MIIALVILGGIVSILCYMLWDLKGNFERHRLQTIDNLYDHMVIIRKNESELRVQNQRVLSAHDFLIKNEKLNSSYQDSVNDAINQINFRLDNQPLYEVGSKSDKDWIVTAVDLVSHPKMQYNYTATNIKTGEIKTWAE